MQIWNITKSKEPGGFDVKGLLGGAEFKQLAGNLQDLCVFSRSTITKPTSAIKTGARHSYAKYLLFPSALRRQFKTEAYDYGRLRCGVLRSRDSVYVIYAVPSVGAPTSEPNGGEDPPSSPLESSAGQASRKWTRYPSLRRWISALRSRVSR